MKPKDINKNNYQMTNRSIHPDLQTLLEFKEQNLMDLFKDLREFVLEIYPESNELLYHTHALTSVFCISDKLSDAFCMIPIYTEHLNLGFNKGTLLNDPHQLLVGTGKLIRHISIVKPNDYRNDQVRQLIIRAVEFAVSDRAVPTKIVGQTISKMKK